MPTAGKLHLTFFELPNGTVGEGGGGSQTRWP